MIQLVGGGPCDFSVTPVPIRLGFLSGLGLGLGQLDLGLGLDNICIGIIFFTIVSLTLVDVNRSGKVSSATTELSSPSTFLTAQCCSQPIV